MTSPYERRTQRRAAIVASMVEIDPEAIKAAIVASFYEADPESAKAAIVASFKADADREESDMALELLAWCYTNEEALVASWKAHFAEEHTALVAAQTARRERRGAQYRPFGLRTRQRRRQDLLEGR